MKDSDIYNTRTPRKPFGAAAAGGVYGGTLGGGGLMPSDLAAVAGTPSNLGKIGDAALADADPLGVNTNVTFDEIGGLDDRAWS
jgi:ATPase family AAA domain-containing protein 2